MTTRKKFCEEQKIHCGKIAVKMTTEKVSKKNKKPIMWPLANVCILFKTSKERGQREHHCLTEILRGGWEIEEEKNEIGLFQPQQKREKSSQS